MSRLALLFFALFFTTGFSYYQLAGQPVIELDGNIVTDGGASDWDSIVGTNNHLSHLVTKSGMLNSTDFVFSSPGHHDFQSVEDWEWDKQHRDHKLFSAYLAAFSDENEFDIFWAVERQPNSGGDTHIGIWLLQDRVQPTGHSHGHFTGTHFDNDLLIVVKVSHTTETEVFRWQDNKLHSIYQTHQNCDDSSSSSPLACAIANHASISASAWATSSRSHAHTIRAHNFVEGGLGLHHALPDVDNLPTYHSVVIEQKDDGHTTSINRDFITGRIQTSGLEFLAKCLIDGCDNVGYANVSLHNTGSQTLYKVLVWDDAHNLVREFDSIVSGATVSVTDYSYSRTFNATASTYPEGYPQNIEVTTGDLMSYDCSSSQPSISYASDCVCQTVTTNASFYYSYTLILYNSGNVGLNNLHVNIPDCTHSHNMEAAPYLCSESTAYYSGSTISHSYPFTGFGGTFSATYKEGTMTFTETISPVTCDMSYCQVTPAITVTTSCDVTYEGMQQVTGTICNRGNVAVNVTAVDSRNYTYEPENIIIQPEACTTVQSPRYQYGDDSRGGSIHVHGVSVVGSIPVDGYQSFYCVLG